MTSDFTSCHLGGDEQLQRTSNADDIALAVLGMCRQASHIVRISSADLHCRAFSSPQLADALSSLARINRYTEVRILVSRPRSIAAGGHHLLTLSRRLSTGVIMRTWALDEHEPHPEYILVDDCGLAELPGRDDEPASINFNNRVRVATLAAEFDDIWHKSKTGSDLRSFVL